jgi:hypothetical protein
MKHTQNLTGATLGMTELLLQFPNVRTHSLARHKWQSEESSALGPSKPSRGGVPEDITIGTFLIFYFHREVASQTLLLKFLACYFRCELT